MRKFIGLALAAWILAGVSAPAGAAIIEILPGSTTVAEGGDFAVDILVSELEADGEFVSAFDLFIGFDPAIIGFDALVFGPDVAAFDLLFGGLAPSGGLVELAGLSFLGNELLALLQGDSVLIATLTFDALNAGTSELTFAATAATPRADVKGSCDPFTPFCDPLPFTAIGEGDVTVEAVVAVTEPGTLTLLAAGLLLLGAARRRRSLVT